MTKDELAEDLAYVRTLAEEGQQAPLIGGRFLVLFGALLGIGYIAQWSALSNLFGPTPGEAYAAIWTLYCLMAVAGVVWLSRGVKALPGGASVANRVDQIVWRTVGIGITATVIGTIARMILQADDLAPNAIMGAAFALFGVALSVTATVSEQRWLGRFSLLSFATSVVLWIFINEPWAYLVAALASFTVLLLPGIMLMRREPSPIV